jgi:hypothetical protein
MRDTAQRVAEVLAEIGRILLLRLAGGQSVTWCVADHVMDKPSPGSVDRRNAFIEGGR